jgi:tungstate transport system substrate-binding protein
MQNFIISIFIYLFTLVVKADNSIILQSTTSLKNSGFYDYILPFIYKDLGIKVNVVAVGTGAAIRNSMNCDGDLLIVHSPQQEKVFMENGFSKKNHYVMHNYYVVVGPKNDPAKISNLNIKSAFKKIFETKSFFISRGDNSGTDYKEKKIWKSLNLNPSKFLVNWYLETGTSMGATINTAVGLNAYTFTDKATWLSFKNKLDFIIYSDDEDNLINRYNAHIINKNKCPQNKYELANRVLNWLLSDYAKREIINLKYKNQRLFFIE